MAENPHRVVVVGGGFGGLYTVKGLRRNQDVAVTLIDRRNFHLFQPLLYQVATGGLSPGDIAAPLRAVFSKQKNTKILLGEVVDFDVDRKVVKMTDGECAYDTLVLAAGTVNNYFGHDEWRASAPGLKSVEDATEIRHRLLFAFEEAEKVSDQDKRRAWLTFIVVGAGPTGVELAGAFGEIANDTLSHDFRNFNPDEARIFLVDGNSRVLTTFPEELSKKAEAQLVDLGVCFRGDLRVTAVDDDGVTLGRKDGKTERIAAKTVIWAAGVGASPLAKVLASRTGAETSKGGHIAVEPDCTVKGHPEIFAIGDVALHPGPDGKPLPGVAPNAIQQGQYVAKAIQKRLKGEPVEPFSYWDKGSLATIGRNHGVADLHKVRFSGVLAWLAWLFVHLFYLVGFQNRVLVFLQWFMNYITFNRGARLITGASNMIVNKQIKETGSVLNKA